MREFGEDNVGPSQQKKQKVAKKKKSPKKKSPKKKKMVAERAPPPTIFFLPERLWGSSPQQRIALKKRIMYRGRNLHEGGERIYKTDSSH